MSVKNRRQSTRNVLQEGGHGAAVANGAVRHLGGGQYDHRIQQLQCGDHRLEQEPHAVHQGDPAILQVRNHPYQQVPQNAGRHEPEAVDAGHQDVLPRNNNVPHAHQHLQQGENFNPEGQRQMAPLPTDEYEPPVPYHLQQQPLQDIRHRAPAALDAGHQEVWPRNNNVPHAYQHLQQGENFNPDGQRRMAPPPVNEYEEVLPYHNNNPYFYNYYEDYYNCQGQNNGQRWIAPQPVATSQCEEVWPTNNNYLRARDQYYGQGTTFSGKWQGPKRTADQSRGQNHKELIRENVDLKQKLAGLEKQIEVFKKKKEEDDRNRTMQQTVNDAFRLAQLQAQLPNVPLLLPNSTMPF